MLLIALLTATCAVAAPIKLARDRSILAVPPGVPIRDAPMGGPTGGPAVDQPAPLDKMGGDATVPDANGGAPTNEMQGNEMQGIEQTGMENAAGAASGELEQMMDAAAASGKLGQKTNAASGELQQMAAVQGSLAQADAVKQNIRELEEV